MGEAMTWPDIETAPTDGTPIWGICMRAQTPKPRVTFWHKGGWQVVAAPEKFVAPGPHKWWPTHWTPMVPPDAARSTEEGE
jgi:hypothetical protein